MKKKSIIARIGVMAAALTLATTSLVSGTFAKYTTNATGVATAMVAKWNVQLKSGTTQLASANVNLGDSSLIDSSAGWAGLRHRDGTNYTYYVDTDTAATALSGSDGVFKIAPGMKGKFPVEVDLTGTEVLSKVTVKLCLLGPEYNEGKTAITKPRLTVVPTNMTFDVEGLPSGFTVGQMDNTLMNATVNWDKTAKTVEYTPATLFEGYILNEEKAAEASKTQKATFNIVWTWTDAGNGSTDADDNGWMETYGSQLATTPLEMQVIVEAEQAQYADDIATKTLG